MGDLNNTGLYDINDLKDGLSQLAKPRYEGQKYLTGEEIDQLKMPDQNYAEGGLVTPGPTWQKYEEGYIFK